MPHVTTDDGVKLYYEEAGEGIPIVFVHEFAGDYRSYEPQMRHFLAPLPMRRLQRARLSALGRSRRGCEVLSGARLRRHPRRARRTPNRQGPYRRRLDGRVRGAAFRDALWRPRALAGDRRMWLRRRKRQSRAVPARGRTRGRDVRPDRDGRGCQALRAG